MGVQVNSETIKHVYWSGIIKKLNNRWWEEGSSLLKSEITHKQGEKAKMIYVEMD